MDETDASDMLLAVGEACNNAVLYACCQSQQPISVSIIHTKSHLRDPGAVQIDIRNAGLSLKRNVEPDCFDNLDLSCFDMPAAELLGDHGRGLPLMNTLADEVEFLEDGGDTVVRLTKRLG